VARFAGPVTLVAGLCALLNGCSGNVDGGPPANAVLLTIDCHPAVENQITRVELLFSEAPYDPDAPPITAWPFDLAHHGIEDFPFKVLIWAGEQLDAAIAIRGLGQIVAQDLTAAEGLAETGFDPSRLVEAEMCLAPPGTTCGDADADSDTDADADAASEAEAREGEGSDTDADADAASEVEAREGEGSDTEADDEEPEVICTPGEPRCDGNDRLVCDTGGLNWIFDRTCEFACRNDDCTACLPDASECDAVEPDTRRYCLPNGSGWRTEHCPGTCLDGRCTLCHPGGDAYCQPDETTRMVCRADGNGFEIEAVCCPPSTCNNGVCVSTAPYIHSIAPDHAAPGGDVYITTTGCNFVPGAKIQVKLGSDGAWADEGYFSNFWSTVQSDTQIDITIQDFRDPYVADSYFFKVRNPDGQESNQIRFHID